jgi:hypothetical protein
MAMAYMVQILMALTELLIAQEFLPIGIISANPVGTPDFYDQFLILGMQVAGPQSTAADHGIVIECDHQRQDKSAVRDGVFSGPE